MVNLTNLILLHWNKTEQCITPQVTFRLTAFNAIEKTGQAQAYCKIRNALAKNPHMDSKVTELAIKSSMRQ